MAVRLRTLEFLLQNLHNLAAELNGRGDHELASNHREARRKVEPHVFRILRFSAILGEAIADNLYAGVRFIEDFQIELTAGEQCDAADDALGRLAELWVAHRGDRRECR